MELTILVLWSVTVTFPGITNLFFFSDSKKLYFLNFTVKHRLMFFVRAVGFN